jgi:hypothetical protein
VTGGRVAALVEEDEGALVEAEAFEVLADPEEASVLGDVVRPTQRQSRSKKRCTGRLPAGGRLRALRDTEALTQRLDERRVGPAGDQPHRRDASRPGDPEGERQEHDVGPGVDRRLLTLATRILPGMKWRTRLLDAFRRTLDHRLQPWTAVALGVVLVLPSLGVGLFGDDTP